MNSNPASANAPGALRQQFVIALAIALGIGAAAISRQSFWIDEADTALVATASTPARAWQTLMTVSGSTLQMPLYAIYVWGWEKIFGHSEWWLRAANLPFLAMGLLALPRRSLIFMAVVVTSAFVWFYLDEARPYALQIGASLLVLGALWRLAEIPATPAASGHQEKTWSAALCLGLVLLSGSSLLGMIWAGIALCAALAVLGRAKLWRLGRNHLAAVLFTAMLLLGLGVFYVWTITQGARASPGKTGLLNAFFASYELFGFTGLGPGRLEIRTGGLHAFKPFVLPLCLYAVAAGIVCLAASAYVVRHVPHRMRLGLLLALGLGAVLLLLAGVQGQFRVLGRHLAPLAAVILFLMSVGLEDLIKRSRRGRLAALAFLALSLASAASMRLAQRHAKDDYRAAAAIAHNAIASNESVWWCASESGASYYGVRLSKVDHATEPGEAFFAVGLPEELLNRQAGPQWVILSKPDVYDSLGWVAAYLEHHHYHVTRSLAAFTVWRPEEH